MALIYMILFIHNDLKKIDIATASSYVLCGSLLEIIMLMAWESLIGLYFYNYFSILPYFFIRSRCLQNVCRSVQGSDDVFLGYHK